MEKLKQMIADAPPRGLKKVEESVSAKRIAHGAPSPGEAAGWMFSLALEDKRYGDVGSRKNLAARLRKETPRRAVFYFLVSCDRPFCSRRFWLAESSPLLIYGQKHPTLDVAYVSKLARLNLTEDETQLFPKATGRRF